MSLRAFFDQLPSLKYRLSIIILAGIGTAVATVSVGRGLGFRWLTSAALGTAISLLLVNFVAKGTTARLRELAAAADKFASGEHHHRVQVRGRDEIGALSTSFNTMASELEATERLRRDLVANASHELRTPIAASRAVLENLVDGVQQPDKATLQSALSQVEHLGRLVDQLFDLSKLESGVVLFAHDRVDLTALVRAQMNRPKVQVALPSTPVIVLGDAMRLQQVLTNLIDNAHHHAPDSERIDVSLRTAAGASEIRIRDYGPGIPAELHKQVFERFARGHIGANSEGAGIGLSIAKTIVEAHGGTIGIEATTNNERGCCVLVSLPLAA